MKQYDFATPYTSLYICGDVHGEFKTLLYNMRRFQIENAIILIAGDCGIGFEKPAYYKLLYNRLETILSKTNNILLLLRGNHDDPAYFDGEQIDYLHMKAIPDYSVIRYLGHTILCIGGATSIDRMQRIGAMWLNKLKNKEDRNFYWENESPVFNDDAFLQIFRSNLRIDTLVTHTAPSFCYPIGKDGISWWLANDATLESDLTAERQTMNLIYDRLITDKHSVKKWFYGHFHGSHTEYISDICFSLLNIGELKRVTANENI